MLKFLLNEKIIQTIVDKITKEVNSSLHQIETYQNEKFDRVINNLEALRLEVSNIEKRLESKEIQDKMNYGQLKYQISSMENKIKQEKPKPQISSH